MKYLTPLILAGAIVAGGSVAFAQSAPAPHPTPNAAMRAQFRQMRTQMRQIHTTERSQILGALTPAHRALLASVAGQLATSTNPDFKGAANRLDAALSSGEKQAILTAAQNARNQQRSLMQQVRARFSPPPGAPRPPRNFAGRRTHHAPDPGMLLLRLSAAPGNGMMMHRRM